MNEQRLQAYLNLIQILLTCDAGTELEILNTHSQLLDAGLVQTMTRVAAMMAENRDRNAIWLQNLAAQLASAIGQPTLAASREEYHNFLMQVLWTIFDSRGNPQAVYPLLQANVNKLDNFFAYILHSCATASLDNVELQQAQDIAVDIANFSNLIQQFPLGNRASNLEIAITGYEIALTVYTREDFPSDWAATQNNLATAYIHRIRGDRAENLEQAIASYQVALTVYTRKDFPSDWAATQNNLATAYIHRIKGDRAENLEQAIAGYQAALTVRTRKDFPSDWASIQNNLAAAYSERIRGDRAENLEQAIAGYQAALTVRTREDFPSDWAATQNNLATAYSNRIRGDKAENLEQAIAGYQAALTVRTRKDFPSDWAMTQNNLATAYIDRIKGDRAKNLEQAIAYCQAALTVYTRKDFPSDWAATQNNLAIAYSDRIRGDRAKNLEQAIAYYQAALTVRTREDFPSDWAMTQNNLATAYSNRIRGDKAENLEQAIAYCQVALTVYTRKDFPTNWAMTQNNLAAVYIHRIRGDRAENIEQAIAGYQAALTVYTREYFPTDWAATQNNLATAYIDRIRGDRAENIEQAIACFRLALEIRTPITDPIKCLQSGRNLGDTAFKAGLWTEAIEGYEIAIAAVEQSRSWATSDSRRQEILKAAINVYENMVQSCINAGQLDKAIECVERSRSKRLVDLMASNDLYSAGEIPQEVQEYLQQYEALQQRIDEERSQNQSDNSKQLVSASTRSRDGRAAYEALNNTLEELESQKQRIWEQIRRLDTVLAGEIQVSAISLASMQQLIDTPTTAILSFYTTDNDTHIFILRKNKNPLLHTCTGQGLETLQSWIFNNWLKPYLSNKAEWVNKISTFLAELSQRLQLNELIAQHLQGIEEIILIPHLDLHQMPFAALPIADPPQPSLERKVPQAGDSNGTQVQYLGDKFLIRYVPSCQILEFCKKRPPIETLLDVQQYGTVEDATEDLLFASFEGSQIAQLYNIPEPQRLKGRSRATVENYRELANKVQVLHSSHHAQSRLDNPLESLLLLGNGTITLGQLMTPGWQLPNLSDVFLSCCETNLGVTEITDDILTLATGFLCAGARSVCSTLWAVDDLATALFSILYYQNRKQGRDRPTALQQAQMQLRSLTGKQLKKEYKRQLDAHLDEQFNRAEAAGDNATAGRIYNTQTRLKDLCRESYPFESPLYWAAFISQGLR
ncbi:MAG: tetratricopeptide repeat protein [Aphanothece sp. CMT-3BRIN-NPC111]|jgi:CHAT domain-containing protein|nr:tetratricopeptide repeat protein [Aphanothece sp. CMT-3BRIN-NPC111]